MSSNRTKRFSGDVEVMPALQEQNEGVSMADAVDRALRLETQGWAHNAFAEKELQTHRAQLAGNAFYQQEFAKRKNTPPTMIHPALRPGVNLLDTSIPLPELDPREVALHMEEQRLRQSAMTTMSPFLNAGAMEQSRLIELDLGTTPEHTPQPTQRAFIEDLREQRQHELSESTASRIPVYKHTPKPTAAEFSAAKPSTGTKKTVEFQEPPRTPVTKSPKKGLLDRFSKWTGRRNTPIISEQDEQDDTHMHPKARAVLGDAPPKRPIGRSPSRSKGLFSRRKSDATEMVMSPSPRPEPMRAATSLGHRTPQSFSSFLPRPNTQSQIKSVNTTPHTPAGSFGRKSILTRSQSLKYLENSVPPTPPAKDTPPDEQSVRSVSQQHRLVSLEQETPSKGFTSSSGRFSPTRLGSYGSRGEGRLVTQPSMYSMRASVVPSAMEASAFEDAKSRLGCLGIEGFSMPHETKRDSAAATVDYSPSIYSPDTFRKSYSGFPDNATARLDRKMSASRPIMDQYERRHVRQMRESPQTTQSAISEAGTIPVVYPELAKDPSIASFMSLGFSPPQPGAMDKAFGEVENMVKEDENNDKSSKRPVSQSSSSSKEGLFAIPLQRGKAQMQPEQDASTAFKDFEMDSSPMAHHPSAIPSPLRNSDGLQYLPATTFTPCPPKPRKRMKNTLQLPKVEEKKSVENMLSPFDPPWTPGGRPKPEADLFKNKPNLSVPKENLVVRQSPPIGGASWLEMDAATSDPKKSSRAHSPPPQKTIFQRSPEAKPDDLVTMQDPMNNKWENMLAMIHERDEVIRDMHKNMQADNARIHQRVASIEIREREGQKRARANKRTSIEKKAERRNSSPMKRISTSYAQDYYRTSKSEDTRSPVDSVAASDSSTIVTAPNLPPANEAPRQDSPTLGTTRLEATVNATTQAVAVATTQQHIDGDSNALTTTRSDEMMNVIRQQNEMMMQMMKEMKDLKQQISNRDNSS